jgi:hypothetical protein
MQSSSSRSWRVQRSRAADLRTVFAVAVGLNDAFRRSDSGSGTPEYEQLRAKLADYDERRTLPCVSAAVELLRTSPDVLLGRSLLELVSSRASSDSRVLPQSLVRFLASRPDEFLVVFANMPMADRCVLVESLETEWPNMRSTIVAEHVIADDDVVANLKRVYCRAAIEVPGNRARAPSDPERRTSRPRLARAWSGTAMTPVASVA